MSVGPYRTVLDLDWTNSGTQTMSTDTTYTVGGLTWTKSQSTNDSTALQLTASTGLVFVPKTTGNYNAGTRTAPELLLPLTQVVPNFTVGMLITVWTYISAHNLTAASDAATCGLATVFTANNVNTLSYYQKKEWNTAVAIDAYSTVNGTQPSSSTDTTNATDNVLVTEARIGDSFMRTYSGVWSSGWPARTALRLRDTIVGTSDFLAGKASGAPTAMGYILGAQRSGSSTALSITFAQSRIDIRY